LRVGIVSGLQNAIQLLELLDSGNKEYDILEVMVCPEGCVNGGGQPIPSRDETIRARSKTITEIDKHESVNVAHKNNAVAKMYSEFARAPGTSESKHLFLAKFEAKKVLK
jgi:iron only hydrogenase large subunit-like protein